MVYRVTKRIKGRDYVYEQRTWREGKRVRTESHYVGPADGGSTRQTLLRKITAFVQANMTPRHAIVDEEKILIDYNARVAREQHAREVRLGELHDRYGLRVADTPRPAVVAPQTPTIATPVTAAESKESPSTSEGQDAQNS